MPLAEHSENGGRYYRLKWKEKKNMKLGRGIRAETRAFLGMHIKIKTCSPHCWPGNVCILSIQAIRMREKKIASEVIAVSCGPAKSEVGIKQ